MDLEYLERLTKVEDRAKSNTNRLDALEKRHAESEVTLNNLDKSLLVMIEQVKTIADDLKQTSINFKEAVTRSDNAQAKDTENLKEKCKELDAKIEKVNAKLEKETIGRDAENWRSSKKQIWSWVLNAVLGLIALALGISKFI